MTDFSIIGKPIAMVDSAGKTTGAGKYTDDLSVPGMLIGKILHSPYPHARIKRIDTQRALALEGVVTVVTGEDAPNTYGILPVGHDETALAVDKVRYVGDNVACVVADDRSDRRTGARTDRCGIRAAARVLRSGRIDEGGDDLIHDNKPHNLEKDYHHVFGDPDTGFREARLCCWRAATSPTK